MRKSQLVVYLLAALTIAGSLAAPAPAVYFYSILGFLGLFAIITTISFFMYSDKRLAGKDLHEAGREQIESFKVRRSGIKPDEENADNNAGTQQNNSDKDAPNKAYAKIDPRWEKAIRRRQAQLARLIKQQSLKDRQDHLQEQKKKPSIDIVTNIAIFEEPASLYGSESVKSD